MKTQTALWALLVVPISAYNNDDWPFIGALTPGGLSNSTAALEAAGRHPNATSSVTFTRTDNNTLETWAWSVNITDVPVPNQPDDLGMPSANNSKGLHVINAQWQLQWPGDNNSSENLQAFLALRNLSINVFAHRISLPSNITSKYTNQDNGNCSTILGDQCTQSLIQALVAGRQIGYPGLKGCASTLDVRTGNADGMGFGETSLMPQLGIRRMIN